MSLSFVMCETNYVPTKRGKEKDATLVEQTIKEKFGLRTDHVITNLINKKQKKQQAPLLI